MISADRLIEINRRIVEEEGVHEFDLVGERELRIICDREYKNIDHFISDIFSHVPFTDGHHRTLMQALWEYQEDLDEDIISTDFDEAYAYLENIVETIMIYRPHPPVDYED